MITLFKVAPIYDVSDASPFCVKFITETIVQGILAQIIRVPCFSGPIFNLTSYKTRS
jgi:hypothetical protein